MKYWQLHILSMVAVLASLAIGYFSGNGWLGLLAATLLGLVLMVVYAMMNADGVFAKIFRASVVWFTVFAACMIGLLIVVPLVGKYAYEKFFDVLSVIDGSHGASNPLKRQPQRVLDVSDHASTTAGSSSSTSVNTRSKAQAKKAALPSKPPARNVPKWHPHVPVR